MSESMTSDGPAESPSGPPEAIGKYSPFARLGNGGMAEVFLAAARGPMGFSKLVVIKRMRDLEGPAFVEMFLDEARLSARLNHPNVVNTYEVGELGGTYFIAMEYLDGQSLENVCRALTKLERLLDENQAAYIITQALKGLHYAHEMSDYDGTPLGVVHRDCSPQNIFLTYNGQVKVIDFGIAKATSNRTQTEAGMLKGKVRYMAPEQLTGSADRRSDVFSIGVLLWQLLTGQRLFNGDTVSVMNQILREDAPSVHSVRPEISAALEQIVAKALQRKPSDRYPSAESMQHDLERFLRTQEAVGEAELGKLVSELFTESRAKVRARIKEYLARVPSQNQDDGLMNLSADKTDLPRLTVGEGTPSAERLPTQLQAGGSIVTRAPSRSLPVAVAGVVLLLGAVGFSRLSWQGSSPAASSLAPSAAASPLRAAITSTPPGALVEWNGKPLDRTPATIELSGEAQTVVLTLEGYLPESVVLRSAGSDVPRYDVTLRPRPAPAAPALSTPPPSREKTARFAGVAPVRETRVKPPAAATASAAPAPAAAPQLRVIEDIPVIEN
jgi:eukaryotic-like serine/threonine-protein kinase